MKHADDIFPRVHLAVRFSPSQRLVRVDACFGKNQCCVLLSPSSARRMARDLEAWARRVENRGRK